MDPLTRTQPLLRTIQSALLSIVMLASVSLGALSVASPACASPLDGAWLPIAPPTGPNSAEAGRTSFTLVLDTSRNRLVAFSGDQGLKNDAWTLSLVPGSAWVKVLASGSPPPGRYGSTAIYDPVGDRMIVFGGYTGTQTNDLWQLTFSGTPVWSTLGAVGTPPTGRQDVASVYDPVGQRMVMFGGYTGAGWTNQTWSLSLTGTPQWTQLTPTGTPPTPRNTFAQALDSSRNRLIVFGGWSAGGYLNDTHALDLAGSGAWSSITTANSPPVRRQACAAYDPASDAVVMFGGFNGGSLGDTWRLPLGGTPDWSLVSAAGTPPTARYGSRASHDPVNGRFLVCGGVDGAYRIDVQGLDLLGSAGWSTVYNDGGAGTTNPGKRRDYSLSLNPATSVAYMFGGDNGGGDTDEMHALHLVGPSPQWFKMPLALPRPSARHGHRSIWDPVRNRVLMFGGYDVNYLNDLWAMTLSPSAAWSQLTTLGTSPDRRMLFGMGYDPLRDRILVVGGHSGFFPAGPEYRNDVWELPLSGPNAMTWAQLAPLGSPPDARWIYGMVLDPLRDRLLLFGGVTSAGRPNDVWALQLAGGTSWSPVTALGVPPSGRSDHAMIYEPAFDRLVVFGGYDGGFRNDAWMLSLGGSQSWTMLAPGNPPPSVRDIMHAVYDPYGARMVLFGGWGGTFLDDTWALTWTPGVVAALASLVSADADPGSVSLRWFVPEGNQVEAAVERSDATGAWRVLGPPVREGADLFTFEDRDVESGASYQYRLYTRLNGEEFRTQPALVTVPSGFELELAGARPNPSNGDGLHVSFSLPRELPARLSLIDAAGRKVASRDLGSLGAGWHLLDAADGLQLAPGMYVIRLETESRMFTRKALVVR